MFTWCCPRELHRLGLVAKLNKTVYGDAGFEQCVEETVARTPLQQWFELVASNPALYRSELQEKFDTRRIGMTGAAEHLDKALDMLHRSVRVINNWLMEIKADQKRIPQFLEDLGLTQSNIVKTPRVEIEV